MRCTSSPRTARTSISTAAARSAPTATGCRAGARTSGKTLPGTRRRGRWRDRGASGAGLMIRYLARRLLQAVPLLLLVSVAVFFLINIVPGGPTAAYENNPRLSAEDIARIEAELGLNQPIHVRYLRWLGAVAHGDWGYSLVTKRPVLVEIGERFPNTLYLIGIQYLVTLAI